MALQPSIRVINGKVFGAYAAQAKNVSYGQGTVEDALDELKNNMTLATLEGTAYTVASGANHAERIPITYPAGYTHVIGVVGFYLGNSVLTPWQIEISGDDVIVNVFNHYGNSANAKTRLTLLFAK